MHICLSCFKILSNMIIRNLTKCNFFNLKQLFFHKSKCFLCLFMRLIERKILENVVFFKNVKKKLLKEVKERMMKKKKDTFKKM